MAGLIVRKTNGQILLDSSKITYGLIKSAYLTQGELWPRKYLRSLQLDPNNGQNWAEYANGTGDRQWTITVYDCVAPIIFLVGDGCLNGISASGTTRTYIFGNASASTRAYVFDQMRDMGSGPRLRMRNANNGRITFNSFMVPLNVIAAVQAPGLGQPYNPQRPNERVTAYAGGYNEQISTGSVNGQNGMFIAYSKVNIGLGGEEYAVHLPYTRGGNAVDGLAYYAVIEGAYGYNGGVTFMFGPAGGTPVSASGWGNGTHLFSNILEDRLPVALVTRTSNLPFPFN